MAIKSKTTFQGRSYNLNDRERAIVDLAQESALTFDDAVTFSGNIQAGASATGAAAGGSAAGTLAGNANAGTIAVGTQLANTNTYTVTFGTAFSAAPNCVVVGLTNYTWAESTAALTITATGNTGTGDLNYICL